MVNNHLKINIGGKEVGLKFGFPQAKLFALALVGNLDIYFDGDTISSTGLSKLIHTAYKNDCLVKEKPEEITFEQISDWVDEAIGNEERKKIIESVVEVWQASEYTKSWVDNLKKNTQAMVSELQKMSKPKETKQKSNLNKSKPRSGGKATARKK